MTDLVAGRYDAGIRIGRLVARDMIAMRISGPLRLVVAASPQYLAQHQRPRTPKDLQAHNCMRLRFPGGAFLPWRFLIDGEVQELEVEGSLIATDPDLLVRASVDAVGVLYSLWDFAAPLITTGKLVPLLEDWMPPPSDGFFLYYPSRRQKPGFLACADRFSASESQDEGASGCRCRRMISGKQTEHDRTRSTDLGIRVAA